MEFLHVLKTWQKKKEPLVVSAYKQSKVTLNKAKPLSLKAVLQSLPFQTSFVAELLVSVI